MKLIFPKSAPFIVEHHVAQTNTRRVETEIAIPLKIRKYLAAAYHEAGHVVAHWALGYKVDRVSVSAYGAGTVKGPIDQETILSQQNEKRKREITRANVVICYAGKAAQLNYDPKAHYGGDEDLKGVFWMFRIVHIVPRGYGRKEYMTFLQSRAQRLVKQYWLAIEEVAFELARKMRLEADELAMLQSKYHF